MVVLQIFGGKKKQQQKPPPKYLALAAAEVGPLP